MKLFIFRIAFFLLLISAGISTGNAQIISGNGSASVNYGARVFITDGNTATWGATVAGNGANKVWAGCNGTNWVVD